MLRSWINAAPARTGVVFDVGGFTAVEVLQRRGKVNLSRRHVAQVPGLFEGPPTPAVRDALIAALRAWPWRFERATNIALPDWLGDFRLFAMDALPNDTAAQCDLVRWRFAKELHYDETQVVCAAQPMGAEGKSQLLAGVLYDKAWCELIQSAFAKSGVPVRALNLEGALRFNSWHDATAQTPGAFVDLQAHSWSLIAWDGAHRLRVIRTKRRSGGGIADILRALHGSTAWLEAGAKIDLWSMPGASSETHDIAKALGIELKLFNTTEAAPPAVMRAMQVAHAA